MFDALVPTKESISILPIPFEGLYELPEGCNIVDARVIAELVPVVITNAALTPPAKLVGLICVVTLSASVRVKYVPCVRSNDAVWDAIVTGTTF
jgi:hypothetical protein